MGDQNGSTARPACDCIEVAIRREVAKAQRFGRVLEGGELSDEWLRPNGDGLMFLALSESIDGLQVLTKDRLGGVRAWDRRRREHRAYLGRRRKRTAHNLDSIGQTLIGGTNNAGQITFVSNVSVSGSAERR